MAVAVYLALLTVRVGLAWWMVRRTAAESWQGPLTILQPILAGDPKLERCLHENLAGNPGVRFVWLVDEDDAEGQEISGRLADERVTLLVGPPPAQGENPKIAKLARAPLGEGVVVVVDDDTRIDEASLRRLTGADLVTGLPVFVDAGTVWERLVGGFVNGSAILTYLPAAAVGAQRTINGMIYATPAATLQEAGGFGAVVDCLTDDYAMAKLYEGQGKTIRQAPVFARVTMTIASAGHCGRVMRRWLIFANRYLAENLTVGSFALVVLPVLLPWVLVGTGWGWVLLGKALVNRACLWRWAGVRSGPVDVLCEVVADLALPVLYTSALVRPGRMSWRSRQIDVSDGRIRYR
jgi:hypothetical protein